MTSARDVVELHIGTARGSGRADGRRSGQVFGTQIPHARRASRTPRALAITVVEASFLTLPVTPSRLSHNRFANHLATIVSAVDLAVVAPSADRKRRMTTRAHSKSMVGHVLARADLLPGTSSRARLRRSTRPRATSRARSCNSWPSPFSARDRALVVLTRGGAKFSVRDYGSADYSDWSGRLRTVTSNVRYSIIVSYKAALDRVWMLLAPRWWLVLDTRQDRSEAADSV